jgi:plastocyanin
VLLRWILPLPLAAAALIALPASAADQSVTAGPQFDFSPAEVTIDIGDKVTWNQSGPFPHNVKFDDGSFEQPADPSSVPWTAERTFDAPGTFRYYCEQHGGPNGTGMAGTVQVRDATGTVPEPVEVPPGLSVSARDEQTLARLVEGQGLRLRARCVNGCDLTAKVSLAPRTAKRLGFERRRVTIGRESDTLPVDRNVPIDVGLRRKAKNKLADAERPFKVRLDVRATNDTSETARRTIKITP